jgi:hypothetical protein
LLFGGSLRSAISNTGLTGHWLGVKIHLPLEKRGGNKRYFEDNISRV